MYVYLFSPSYLSILCRVDGYFSSTSQARVALKVQMHEYYSNADYKESIKYSVCGIFWKYTRGQGVNVWNSLHIAEHELHWAHVTTFAIQVQKACITKEDRMLRVKTL